jgi:hypothetical protein
MKSLPLYNREFLDYDNDVAFDKIAKAVEQYGFRDCSWHNDTQPKLELEVDRDTCFVIWVDYSDPALSEHGEQRITGEYNPYILAIYRDGEIGISQTGETWEFNTVDGLIDKVKEMCK